MTRSRVLLFGLVIGMFSLVPAGSGTGQERPRTIAAEGGGVGVRLDADAGHVMTAYRADGGLRTLCLRGDEHEAMAGVEEMLEVMASEEAAWSTIVSRGGEGSGARATIEFDRRRLAGADRRGWPLLYTPLALQLGSTRSHFDTWAFPNLLMEPAINPDLPLRGVDVTGDALSDLGFRRGGGLELELRYLDPDGQGFNDPELGAVRRAALRTVARIWGRHLRSRAPVVVDAQFQSLPCTAGVGAVLAGASPTFVFRDFEGAVPRTWYAGAMADSIARADLAGSDEADLFIVFNSAIDEECLGEGTGWYYDSQGEPPANRIPFLLVGLHEMAHGLGFSGFVDLGTGEYFEGFPDIYTRTMEDNRLGKRWDQMGNAQRRRSAVRDGEVVLKARRARRAAARKLGGSVVVRIGAPASIAGAHRAAVATFGPRIEDGPLSGDLALVNDGTATPRFACEPLVNPTSVAGKIAVIVRGDCNFTMKVAHAQAAGAIGAVIVNNVPGAPDTMGGVDDSITIPAVMVSRRAGAEIREALR